MFRTTFCQVKFHLRSVRSKVSKNLPSYCTSEAREVVSVLKFALLLLLYSAGSMNYLGLASNAFSGRIPSHLGQLQGASVFVKDNLFDTSVTAPLSLCNLFRGEEFDLADDVSFCPTERNALSDFYDAAKGSEWTESTYWKDEYISHCKWHGVKCVKNRLTGLNLWNDGLSAGISDRVTELKLWNNGLSGRLSESIGNLASIEKLDLSDNDIKVMTFTECFAHNSVCIIFLHC